METGSQNLLDIQLKGCGACRSFQNQRGIVMCQQLGQHASFNVCPFRARGDQESLWAAHALPLVVAVPVPLDGRERNAKELYNLGTGAAQSYSPQDMLT